MEKKIIYADIRIDCDDWFVITPEGNEFTFPHEEYNEYHNDIEIVDPKSDKTYIVRFNV